jgi:hypothetical protein
MEAPRRRAPLMEAPRRRAPLMEAPTKKVEAPTKKGSSGGGVVRANALLAGFVRASPTNSKNVEDAT